MRRGATLRGAHLGRDLLMFSLWQHIDIFSSYLKYLYITTSEGKASAVHFLHFKFNDELVEAFKNKENIIQIGIDHEAYGHLSIVSDRVREELAKEFI